MRPLRIFAVLFGLLALSIFLKPFGFSAETGFVFLGHRLSGVANLIASGCFALFLTCYAVSLWREKAAALPLGVAYAGYVSANVLYTYVFTLRMPAPAGNAHVFDIYAIVALGVAWGVVAAMVLGRLAEREAAPGRTLLRSFALLFALMALSNALKPFVYARDVGFVFFGHRLAGAANTVVALTFSALLATYAVSIWAEKRRALYLGIAYALYVFANLILWGLLRPAGDEMPIFLALPYLGSAIGVSSGAALLLWRHRERFV